MDPDTTLVAFMLQTEPTVQFVHLIGSWDNFDKYYTMERDSRKGQGHWRGCYSFRDIICEDESDRGLNATKRNGGLKMGNTYYYYYELDGSKEIHDPSMPSTTTCLSLPGQPVNTLSIPVEHTLRSRSASLNSVRTADYRTMNPRDKFVSPRPAPPVPSLSITDFPSRPDRLGSSPAHHGHKVSRSVSPAPSWRRFLSFRVGSSGNSNGSGNGSFFERGRPDERPITPLPSAYVMDDSQSVTSESGGGRTRDISPESLRRFLVDDAPLAAGEEPPSVVIPEDIDEENEDDDNFAPSAGTEHSGFFATCLSPPPSRSAHQRGLSASSWTMGPEVAVTEPAETSMVFHACDGSGDHDGNDGRDVATTAASASVSFALPRLDTSAGPRSHFSMSTTASSVASPLSPRSPEDELPSFLEPIDRDDPFATSSPSKSGKGPALRPMTRPTTNSEPPSADTSSASPFAAYCLPREKGAKLGGEPGPTPSADNGVDRSSSLLDIQISGDADDFANELGWIVDVIQGKTN